MKNIKILAIETSCDETAAAVIGTTDCRQPTTGKEKLLGGHRSSVALRPVILSSVVSSQIDLHAKTGGVVPEVASRAHMEVILPIITEALVIAGISKNDITHIAVTSGPGLIGSLLVGFNAAKSLAYALDKPIIPINHIEGHIYSAMAEQILSPKSQILNKSKISNSNDQTLCYVLREFEYPLLALVVSGGHTSLIYTEKPGEYRTIGATLDDAAGEVFDKVAKLLELGYPGGPIISKMAEKWRNDHQQGSRSANKLNHESRIKNYGQGRGKNIDCNSCFVLPDSNTVFPRPLINDGTFNFSFSGLKTAVLRGVQKYHLLGVEMEVLKNIKSWIATAFEDAVVDVLVTKTLRAIEKYKPRTVVLAGGVAANSRLRQELKLKIVNCKLKINLMIPPLDLCGDNAVMIGLAAYYRIQSGKTKRWDEIRIDSDWELS